MTEISRYRDGSLNSTDLIEDEMVKTKQLSPEERREMHWRANAETWSGARARIKAEDAAEADPLELHRLLKEDGKAASELVVERVTPEEAALEPSAFAAVPEYAGFMLAQAGEILKGQNKTFDDLDATHEAERQDSIVVTALGVLDLSNGFRDAEEKKYPLIGSRAEYLLNHEDKKLVPLLQASADAGSQVARDALAYGREGYLRAHPDVARRMQIDVAFHLGFENVMYLGAKHPGELDGFMKKVDARNPWTAADLQVRA